MGSFIKNVSWTLCSALVLSSRKFRLYSWDLALVSLLLSAPILNPFICPIYTTSIGASAALSIIVAVLI